MSVRVVILSLNSDLPAHFNLVFFTHKSLQCHGVCAFVSFVRSVSQKFFRAGAVLICICPVFGFFVGQCALCVVLGVGGWDLLPTQNAMGALIYNEADFLLSILLLWSCTSEEITCLVVNQWWIRRQETSEQVDKWWTRREITSEQVDKWRIRRQETSEEITCLVVNKWRIRRQETSEHVDKWRIRREETSEDVMSN